MDTLLNLAANVSGLWKKVAALLPLVLGAGTLLVGVGGVLLELGHAGNAAAALKVIQGLQSDPNTAMVLAGLTALGIHQNHTATVAVLDDHAAKIDAAAAPAADPAATTSSITAVKPPVVTPPGA